MLLQNLPGNSAWKSGHGKGGTADDTIREQILAIRATGLTNMFDVTAVQRLAFERDYFELVCYIDEDKAGYVRFILTGE